MYRKPRWLAACIFFCALATLPMVMTAICWREVLDYAGLSDWARYFPYCVAAIGVIFGLIRHHAREVYLLVLIIVVHAAWERLLLGQGLAGFQKILLLNLLAILLPLNFWMAGYFKASPVFHLASLKQLAFIVMQIVIVHGAVVYNPLGMVTYLSLDVIAHWPWRSVINQPAQVLIFLSLVALCMRWLFSDRLCGAWLFSLVILIVALAHFFDRALVNVGFSFAGMVLLGTLVFDKRRTAGGS